MNNTEPTCGECQHYQGDNCQAPIPSYLTNQLYGIHKAVPWRGIQCCKLFIPERQRCQRPGCYNRCTTQFCSPECEKLYLVEWARKHDVLAVEQP